MSFRNLSLGKKIGAGYAVILVLTALVGLTGHHAVSRVIHDAGFNQQLSNIQAIFTKARLESKTYLLHNHVDGRKLQAAALKKMTGHLGRSKAVLESIIANRDVDKRLKAILTDARQEINGFEKTCLGFQEAEKVKMNLARKILPDIKAMVTRIEGIKFWIEELLPAAKDVLAQADSYMDRQTPPRWERLTKSYRTLGKALDDWYVRIERSEKLRAIGDRLKGKYKTMRGLIVEFHEAVERQAGLLAAMDRHEAGMEKLLGQLADATLEKMKGVEAISNRLIFTALAVALLLGCIFALVAISSIVRPVKTVSQGLQDIAQGEGDLTRRLPVQSRDEVGRLAQWFNQFLEKMGLIIAEIADNSSRLKQSSQSLLSLAGRIASASKQMADQSGNVSSSAQQMSEQMNAVTASSNEATDRMGIVATATEQMSATLAEIARNTEKGRAITAQAVEQSQFASGQINELGRAAQQISQVTEVITEISEQTNLLALNATIEAARAGEAGKGFAVVANEIKGLARQTAEATGKIKDQIDGIQNSTQDTVGGIEQILATINQVNDIVNSIANSIEEQSTATREIAGNVEQAASGMENINRSVAMSTDVAGSITNDILNIDQNISQTTAESSKAQAEANALMQMAQTLEELVGRFKI